MIRFVEEQRRKAPITTREEIRAIIEEGRR
jgi:hypothetical protein